MRSSRIRVAITTFFFLSSALFAVESTFDGYIRSGYILQNQSNIFQNDALGLGGKIGAKAELSRHIEFNTALYAVERLTSAGAPSVAGDFFDSSDQSYAFVGEASLSGEYQYHSFNFGRQKIDTAHADSDDIRMVPDLFVAYAYKYEGFCDTTLELVHFTHMAGWENGSDPKIFVTMHDVLGITDANGAAINSGVTMAHIAYDNELFSFDAYEYYLYSAFNMVYLEAGYNKAFSEAFSLSLGLQYNANLAATPFTNNGTLVQGINAQVIGAQATVGLSKWGTEIGIAADLGIGSDAILGSWGGGPYFTSIEDATFDAIGDATGLSYLVSLSQELYEGLSFSYTYGVFQGSDISVNHLSEHDLSLNYELENKITWVFTYAVIQDHISAANNFEFFYSFLQLPLIY